MNKGGLESLVCPGNRQGDEGEGRGAIAGVSSAQGGEDKVRSALGGLLPFSAVAQCIRTLMIEVKRF